jgi:hypothetical protein
MVQWPGPSGLRALWESDQLSEEDRVALLLGAAAHHDARLLRLYREAVGSDSQRLRQAGVYGFHDLIGDRLPDVSGGVDDRTAELIEDQISAIYWTARRDGLVAMWLQAALVGEDKVLPGFRGLAPERGAADCFRAVDRLMQPEDLDLLVTAYRVSTVHATRLALLTLIEGLTLSRYVVKPIGDRKPWGSEIYDAALVQMDSWVEMWLDRRCTLDYRQVVAQNLARVGAVGVDPLHPDACHVWGLILQKGDARWWATAARRLYECGGPWSQLSVLQADSKANRARRDRLVRWFRLRD